MSIPSAIAVLRALALGRDPHTGEPLPPDNPCHRPETIRALFAGVEALQSDTKRSRSGAPWHPEDNQALIALFDQGKSISELAKQFHRTPNAIRKRLRKLERDPNKSVPSTSIPQNDDSSSSICASTKPPRQGMPWTRDEVDTLQTLRRQEVSLQKIAERLGRSLKAVEMKLALIQHNLEKEPRMPLFRPRGPKWRA